MDRAAGRADPQGRLRLRGAALLPPQVRRHDHQHRHLPRDAGAVRPPHPPADRRRLRHQRRPDPRLSRPGDLDAGRVALRHRHLDDDDRSDRRLRRLPDAASGRRSTTPRIPARTWARCSARSSGRCWRMARDNADRWLAITGSHEVPAYGFERYVEPAPLEVNTLRLLASSTPGLADPRRHVARMLRAGRLQERGRAGRRRPERWPRPRRSSSASTAESGEGSAGSGRMPTTDELSDAVAGFHFPDDLWARVVYDLLVSASFGEVPDRAARGGVRADLLRARRQPRDREPATVRRAGRGARRAAGSRVRAAQAVPRRALARSGAPAAGRAAAAGPAARRKRAAE